MLGQLRELGLSHVHQGVDFIFRALEILDAEGVDRDRFHSRFVADL